MENIEDIRSSALRQLQQRKRLYQQTKQGLSLYYQYLKEALTQRIQSQKQLSEHFLTKKKEKQYYFDNHAFNKVYSGRMELLSKEEMQEVSDILAGRSKNHIVERIQTMDQELKTRKDCSQQMVDRFFQSLGFNKWFNLLSIQMNPLQLGIWDQSAHSKFVLAFATKGLNFENFKLLFNAVNYGFSASAFHRFCDEKNQLAIVCKTEEGRIFAVYTKRGFKKDPSQRETKKNFSFLVSIRDTDYKLHVAKDGRDPQYQREMGPCFYKDVTIGEQCHLQERCSSSMGHYFKIHAINYPLDSEQAGCYLVGRPKFRLLNYVVMSSQ